MDTWRTGRPWFDPELEMVCVKCGHSEEQYDGDWGRCRAIVCGDIGEFTHCGCSCEYEAQRIEPVWMEEMQLWPIGFFTRGEVWAEALNTLGAALHKTARSKGFWDGENNDGEKIALIHSELSELLEALRKDAPEPDKHCPEFSNAEIEWADALIRLLEYGSAKGYRGQAVLAKWAFNKTRPAKHGKRF